MGSSNHRTPIIICIGSNEPDANTRVLNALKLLGAAFEITETAGPYQTIPAPPADPEGSPYANAVVECRTVLTHNATLELLKQYERRLGRRPEHKAEGKVIIDIDLVVYDDDICRKSEFISDYFQTGYRQLSKKRSR